MTCLIQEVFPILPSFDFLNTCVSNGIVSGYFIGTDSVLSKKAYFNHIRRIQFRCVNVLSFCLSSLCGFIPVVVRLCSKKEVVRIDASPNIAFMKNAHILRDRPFMNKPGKPVAELLMEFIMPRARGPVSVYFSVRSTFPKPACLGKIYFLIETILEWFHNNGLSQELPNMSRSVVFGLPTRDHKGMVVFR